ncbi:MAG: nucleotidyltransferase domain-containing protein [Candidatus Asgardarchaeia archaeon]
MKEKVVKIGYQKTVVYDEKHWKLLKEKRSEAIKIMEQLEVLSPRVHGSICRGDVHKYSDIDIIILRPTSFYRVLSLLNIEPSEVFLVQATPKHTPKVRVYLNEEIIITYPLIEFTSRELDFYKFGGMLNLKEIKEGKRVPGINKKLVLVQPTKHGHLEWSILDNPVQAAKIVGVNYEIINERIKVLTRRDEIGRTGVFLKIKVPPDRTPEQLFAQLVSTRPTLRRLLRKRGKW